MAARLEIVDQIAELQQPAGGTTTEGTHRFRVTHHIPKRNAQLIGSIGEPLDRGFADTALGHIYHPQQADGVCRVNQLPQMERSLISRRS